jgi:hypothetical protein
MRVNALLKSFHSSFLVAANVQFSRTGTERGRRHSFVCQFDYTVVGVVSV